MISTTSILGKRKLSSRSKAQRGSRSQQYRRKTAAGDSDSGLEDTSEDDSSDVGDIFRRHFEARFAPLDGATTAEKQLQASKQGEYNESNSVWEGLSEEEPEDENAHENGTAPVEIVEHKEVQRRDNGDLKAEKRAFMRHQPPLLAVSQSERTDATKERDDEEERSETLNLKNDIELQRLIQESHLLDQSKASNLHNQRQKILDMRLQALGSKKSVLEQHNGKMPMRIRKGITAKAKQKEEKRRTEAKENGIILERATQKVGANGHKIREGGVSDPSVGKFRGGATLQLSKRDIAEIRGNRHGSSASRASDHLKKKKKSKKAGKRR